MEHYKLVKEEKLSGAEASVYSVFLLDKQDTLFNRFINGNKNSFKSELKDENYFLRQVAKDIQKRMQEGEIEFSEDYMDLLGNLEFKSEDYE
jgi:hypothetical protein